MGGPGFIETLFPTLLGIVYTLAFLILLLITALVWFSDEVKASIAKGLLEQNKEAPVSLWHRGKRFVSFIGTVCIIVSLAQAGWGYVMTVAILTAMLSFIMVRQMKELHEKTWLNHVDVRSEAGEPIEGLLITNKNRD